MEVREELHKIKETYIRGKERNRIHFKSKG